MHQLAAEQSQQLTRQNKSQAMYCSSKIMDMLTFHFLRFNFWVKRQKKQNTLSWVKTFWLKIYYFGCHKHSWTYPKVLFVTTKLAEDVLTSCQKYVFSVAKTWLKMSHGLVKHTKFISTDMAGDVPKFLLKTPSFVAINTLQIS